jgi:hypothetical protein
MRYQKAEGDHSLEAVYTDLSKTCVTVRLFNYGRIGKFGQDVAKMMTGRDVPWIWSQIDYTLCCDGSYKILYGGSHFPSHIAYLNGVYRDWSGQTDLERFIMEEAGQKAAGGLFHTEEGNVNE